MDKENQYEISIDLYKSLENTKKDFEKNLEMSNKIWHDALRLTITLSASFLVLTIALFEKIFPISNNYSIPVYLIIAWISFFLAIVFSIIAGLKGSLFYTKMAKINEDTIKVYNRKIADGKSASYIPINNDTTYIIYNSIVWGAISLDSFILAILSLCVALLTKLIPSWICLFIFIISIILLAILSYLMIEGRKKPITNQFS